MTPLNKDTVIGIVGSIVLVAAMIGVFTYERSQANAGAFAVTWESVQSDGPTAEGSTPLQQSTETTVDITQTNLTSVDFTVAWTPTQGTDTLRVTVTPPEGSGLNATDPVEGDSGSITVTVPIPNEVPTVERASGADESDATARLAGTHASTLGTGTWTITVEFVSATGVVPVPGAPVGSDTEVAWTAASSLTHYAPALSRA